MKVTVIFNGIPREIEISKRTTTRVLMHHAIQEFNPTSALGQLAFFTKDGSELSDGATLADSGVRNGDNLLLRPTMIR